MAYRIQISFKYSKKILNGKLNNFFYNTYLYFTIKSLLKLHRINLTYLNCLLGGDGILEWSEFMSITWGGDDLKFSDEILLEN